MNGYLAQKLIISVDPQVGAGTPIPPPIAVEGPLKGIDGIQINKIADLLNVIIKLLFPLAAILLFFFLLWGGYNYLTSAGDPEKLKHGKAKITSSAIGFILLIMSYFMVSLIARIFGLGGGIF